MFKVSTKATVYMLTGARTALTQYDEEGVPTNIDPDDGTVLVPKAQFPASTEVLVRGDMSTVIDDEQQELEFKGRDFQFIMNTIRKAPMEFAVPMVESNTFYKALLKAKLQKTTIALAFLSDRKNVAGAQGWIADWTVTKFERGEVIRDIQMINTGVAFGYSSIDPEWIKLTDGDDSSSS